MSAAARVRLVCQIECGVDQGDMREGLGEIADQTLELDIELFREQAEVVAQLEKAFEESLRIFDAADGLERADHPEAAGQKNSFAARKPVVNSGCVVALDEAVWREFALDGFDSRFHARVAA